jgi:2-amino-4-hydroxy-6-hydroxymethyldihydropteridine diphosphokinase
MKAPILIAIGSNLTGPSGAPLDACRSAVEALAALPAMALVGCSRWYDTEPVPKSMQPHYVNAVARFAWRADPLDPAVLLASLAAIEASAGRRRGEPDAARTLDLDIVAIGDLVRDTPDPILPHPRAHLRRFVLEPLRDVCPEWIHPRLGRELASLIDALPAGGTRLLAADGSDR